MRKRNVLLHGCRVLHRQRVANHRIDTFGTPVDCLDTFSYLKNKIVVEKEKR